MKLLLCPIPAQNLGIYPYPGGTKMPERACFLHPDAAESLFGGISPLGLRLRFSDILRTAEASLLARKRKRGVQPPGYSAHNFGLAVDLDIQGIFDKTGWRKPELDAQMEKAGWYCHRRDHRVAFEAWHYNYLGKEAESYLAFASKTTTAAAIETKIQTLYGPEFELSKEDVQAALARLKFYGGEIDGILGPRSKEAILAFQRAWSLKADSIAGPKTQRTLAVVAADSPQVVALAA